MIAEVIIQSNAKELNKVFDYNIPTNLEEKIKVGSRVLVPFGNVKTLEDGFVIGIKENSEYKVKDIANVQEECINNEKIELAKWMAKRYFCNISDCLKLMLPPGTRTKMLSNRIKEKKQLYVILKKDKDEIENDIENKKITSNKQIRVLKFLIDNDGAFISEIEMFTDITKVVIDSLSPIDNLLCKTAILSSPNLDINLSTVCGVSEISGTSIILLFPCLIVSSIS